MVGLLDSGRSRAVLAATVLLLVAGCGTRHSAGAGAVRSGPARARPGPSATGHVKRAGFLTGVACVSARACVAVGWYYYGGPPGLTLAARWNGRAWLTEPTPSRGRDSLLSAVSCASPSSCVALGVPAEAWDGARWAVIPPAGAMSSVSCPVPGSCQAVGPPPDGVRPVAARWDGRAWQAEPVPRLRPVPQTLTLASVSCTSAAFCMAVGNASRGAKARSSRTYRDITLAELWDGSRWRLVRTPNPSRASELSGVSCTSPTACTAVGSSVTARTLAERWNGTRWAIQRTPNIGHIGYTALTAVSCASATACTAVGTYNDGVFGVAEHWNGARWTIQRLPVPPGHPGEDPLVLPVSVSCTSVTACVTVGTTQNQTLAEAWTGARWIIQRTPNPS